MSANRTFVDTNILVYAYDTSAGTKRLKAQQILADLWHSGLGVISTQVLQELFVTVTRKLPKPMEIGVARNIVSDLLMWDVITIKGEHILDAIDLHKTRGYSFWDCLIISAAIQGGCVSLLSEDLSSGDTVGTCTIKNPFQ